MPVLCRQESAEHTGVALLRALPVPLTGLPVYLFADTAVFINTAIYEVPRPGRPILLFFSFKIISASLAPLYFHVNSIIMSSIVPKKSCLDFDKVHVKPSYQFGGN